MYVLNLISISVWAVIAFQALRVVINLRSQGLSRCEITAITILLLSTLNITRGTVAALVFIPPENKLLEYFYIGSSVFQILLCDIVLKYINYNKGR